MNYVITIVVLLLIASCSCFLLESNVKSLIHLHASNKHYNNRNSKSSQGSIKPITHVSDIPQERRKDRSRLKDLTITGASKIAVRNFNINSRFSMEYINSFVNVHQIPLTRLPEIAILGRSNVGKSSLLNMLSGARKKLAIVSKMPGRTRMVNLFNCKDEHGVFCTLADLPGYGFAKMSKELKESATEAATGYLHSRNMLRAALVLIDCRRGYQDSDTSVLQMLTQLGIPFSIVVTKVDVLSAAEFAKVQKDIIEGIGDDTKDFPVVMCSSTTGFGKKDVWSMIHQLLFTTKRTAEEAPQVYEEPVQYVPEEPRINQLEWFPGDRSY